MRRKESSARQRAYDLIQKKILSGAWPGGAVVSELVLSREMGSSRTPILEAVRQLAGEGLLSHTSHGPMAVTNLTRVDIAKIYELREAPSARLLAFLSVFLSCTVCVASWPNASLCEWLSKWNVSPGRTKPG